MVRRITLRMAEGGLVDKALGALDNAAQYWQERAASQSPSEKIIESIHPLYAVGSAMGGVREAMQHGDVPGAVISGLGAIPTFGWVKAHRSLNGALTYAPGMKQGLRSNTAGTVGNVSQPAYDAVKGY